MEITSKVEVIILKTDTIKVVIKIMTLRNMITANKGDSKVKN